MSFYNSRELWCAWKQGQALLRRGMDNTHNIIMVLHGLLRRWHLWKVHDDLEEMVMATVQMGDYVQTMGRQAANWGLWSASPFERGKTCSLIRRW